MDTDGNGEIDFKEFCTMMQKLIIEGESDTSMKNKGLKKIVQNSN